jgi:hypothetical protein
MKTTFKLITAFMLTLSMLGLYAPAVLAAAPGNDVFSGATAVASLPFSDSVDTTQATTDADDAQLNTNCGAPATDASVWYAVQGTDQTVVVDVSQSDYSAGVLVGVGSQGNLQLVTCGPGAVAFFAAAGTTYYVLAIDDQLNGDGLNGGNLSIAFSEVVSPTIDSFTVNRYGTVNTRTGVATISGTYICSHADFMDVFVDARQPVGRFAILGSGEFFDFNTCDGARHTWAAQVFPQNGKFAGGKTMTLNFATSCGPLECAFGFVEQKVQLRGGK